MPAVEEENKKASVHSSGFRTFLTSAMGVCLFLFAWATSTKIYRFVWASLAGYDVGLGTDHLVTYQTTTQQLLDPSWVADSLNMLCNTNPHGTDAKGTNGDSYCVGPL